MLSERKVFPMAVIGSEKPLIGYEKAKNLMKQLDWKMRFTAHGEEVRAIEIYHPCRPTVYGVRRDTGQKLLKECRVICRGENNDTAILCYNHDGSDENLI